MRAVRLVVALALLLSVPGCASNKNAVMPDVKGKKLDVAKGAIKAAGYDDDVKVDGGGLFGVVNESNWEVCEQSPAAGENVSGAPRLKVDRSCDNDGEQGKTSAPSETTSETSKTDTAESTAPAAERVLTVKNSNEFARLLKVSDPCDGKAEAFATKYADRTIKFNGSIKNLAKHGDNQTRYDILVAPGSKGPNATVGPDFKFEDVNVFDLHLRGSDVPSSLGDGDRFRFVAKVVRFNPGQCLFFLEPVSTRVR